MTMHKTYIDDSSGSINGETAAHRVSAFANNA